MKAGGEFEGPQLVRTRIMAESILVVLVPDFEVCADGGGRPHARYRLVCTEEGDTWDVRRRWSECRGTNLPPLLRLSLFPTNAEFDPLSGVRTNRPAEWRAFESRPQQPSCA